MENTFYFLENYEPMIAYAKDLLAEKEIFYRGI